MKITRPEIHAKTWGAEFWIVNKPEYCGKILFVHPENSGSIHYHKVKDETFHVLRGNVFIDLFERIGQDTLTRVARHAMNPGMTLHIPPHTIHRITCASPVSAEVLEISTQHVESDSYRIK